jgi:osmotically-inducible protein OsmY
MKNLAGMTVILWAVVASGAIASGVSYAAENAGQEQHSQTRKQAGDTPREYPADNTGRNVRDRDESALTAGQQNNNQSDLKITQELRRAITSDKELSTNAHNVKIITKAGVVTLRGPVKDANERAKIAAKAKSVSGVSRVENQLEVASQ